MCKRGGNSTAWMSVTLLEQYPKAQNSYKNDKSTSLFRVKHRAANTSLHILKQVYE